MALDAGSVITTINYDGGSMTTTVGLLEAIWGKNYPGLQTPSTTTQVSVKAHTRKRVIGGPSTNVGAYTYSYKQWPTSEANNCAGGGVVLLRISGVDGVWTARISGSMSDFGSFLDKQSPKAINFRTERGTKYGPFQKGTP